MPLIPAIHAAPALQPASTPAPGFTPAPGHAPELDPAAPAIAPANAAAAPNSIASQAQLLVDLKEFEPRLMDAIHGAKKVINVEMFNLAPDGSGGRVTEALIAKAKEGVEVNVVLDRVSLIGLPSWAVPHNLERLTSAGGHFVMTNPFSSIDARTNVTHRKAVTVDGTRGFAGGVNLSRMTDKYHDAMFEVTGASAAKLAADQLARWTALGKTASPVFRSAVSDALAATDALRPDSAAVEVLDNSPTKGARVAEVSDFYRQSIRTAKDRLWIASPGWTDPDMVSDITAAATRGVDVRVITSGKPPLHAPPIIWSTRSALRELLAAGGKIFETPNVSHTKAIVADGAAAVGSYNITRRSALHDHEIALATHEPEVVQQVAQLFLNDFAASKRLTTAETTSGLGQRGMNFLSDKFHFGY